MDQGTSPANQRQAGIPIALALAAAIGLLVTGALGVLFYAAYSVAQENTYALVRQKATLITDSILEHTRSYLDPAMRELEFLGGLIADGRLDVERDDELVAALLASLAAAPQVSVVAFVDLDLKVHRAFRNRPAHPVDVRDWSDDRETMRLMALDAALTDAHWGSLFVAEDIGLPFINARKPVRLGGRFVGSLLAGVSIKELSEFLVQFHGEDPFNSFILFGTGAVLAHASLKDGYHGLTDARPLPLLDELGDPVLRQIWSEDRDPSTERLLEGAAEVRAVRYQDNLYVFLFRRLIDYAEQPLIVGTYARFDQLAEEVYRLQVILYVGIGVLSAALLTAIVLGRMLTRPIRRLSVAATHIRDLDIDGAPRLQRGMFRELNEAAGAFNAMVATLSSFGSYVPRALVRRLMRAGGPGAVVSEQREVTVMFTDIVGFTALSEHLPAGDVAAFLNQHIAIIDRCVEAEEGTIDKYIGDAVMVFWGAPETQPDQADRACRAAVSIAREIHTENVRRRLHGEPAIRVRIGIHSGPAVVGNVGATTRFNYTIIGDTVNTAERIEVLSRELVDPATEVYAALSAATAERLRQPWTLIPHGPHHIRGREQPIELYGIDVAAD